MCAVPARFGGRHLAVGERIIKKYQMNLDVWGDEPFHSVLVPFWSWQSALCMTFPQTWYPGASGPCRVSHGLGVAWGQPARGQLQCEQSCYTGGLFTTCLAAGNGGVIRVEFLVFSEYKST